MNIRLKNMSRLCALVAVMTVGIVSQAMVQRAVVPARRLFPVMGAQRVVQPRIAPVVQPQLQQTPKLRRCGVTPFIANACTKATKAGSRNNNDERSNEQKARDWRKFFFAGTAGAGLATAGFVGGVSAQEQEVQTSFEKQVKAVVNEAIAVMNQRGEVNLSTLKQLESLLPAMLEGALETEPPFRGLKDYINYSLYVLAVLDNTEKSPSYQYAPVAQKIVEKNAERILNYVEKYYQYGLKQNESQLSYRTDIVRKFLEKGSHALGDALFAFAPLLQKTLEQRNKKLGQEDREGSLEFLLNQVMRQRLGNATTYWLDQHYLFDQELPFVTAKEMDFGGHKVMAKPYRFVRVVGASASKIGRPKKLESIDIMIPAKDIKQ